MKKQNNSNSLWNHRYIYLISWNKFEERSQVLFNEIVNSGYTPNVIISIAKGGLVIGTKLAYLFDVQEFGVIHIKRNTTSDLFSVRNSPELCWAKITEITDLNILIIDDIVGTGDTMNLSVEIVKSHNPRTIKTLSLVVNKNAKKYPDFLI
ncbi:MAG: phosphoribosyltransferase [Candidatus Magnetoglobus multicellularis str. Araruama]|uniref:Phosphoribosyltransferase n=1 Tax=Candidatus Magnetoglobus multicellularis str. Araruama TaxID=890399 RepID=A0A1V1P5X3_9BACT|nr:MAG: phosphoribosyltransferase [Candidatus Magnetoglobus multicellularis str. Araruama]